MKNTIIITVKLLVIAVACAALLGAVYSITKGPIAEQEEKAAAEARLAAFPEAADFNKIIDKENADDIPEEYGIIKSVYEAVDGSGNVIGTVFGITTKGYSPGLNMTVGINADGTVKAVIMGDNGETQGIGKEAAKPAFYGQFLGKSIERPFNVVRSSPQGNDIQSISGATITSKAFVSAVNTAIEYYKYLGGEK